MKQFMITAAADRFFPVLGERQLRGVGLEGGNLSLHEAPDIDGRGARRQGDGRAAWDGKVRGTVIQLLSAMRRDAIRKLMGEAVIASGPMEGERGKDRDHGMIGVSGDGTLRTHGDEDVGAEFTDVAGNIAGNVVQILAMELAVGIIKHETAGDLKNPAGGSEFHFSDGSQFLITPRTAAMGSSLARS